MALTERTLSSFPHLVIVLVVHCVIPYCLANGISTDKASLLALKSHITSDPNNHLAANWSAATSVCKWIGVTCGHRQHRVIALDISNMNLTGTIPPQLGNLSFLSFLCLNSNHFSGHLPTEMAGLRRLKDIYLGYNYFTGEIPIWLGLLPQLIHLQLCTNSFTGIIPSSLSNISHLRQLELSNNLLHGKIPEEIGNLVHLRMVGLLKNNLRGPIPLSIFNISTLEFFSMSGNFSGVIPQEIGNLQNLQIVVIRQSQLLGPIPKTLFNITTLEFFDLSDNSISDSIPADMCVHLPNLQTLNTHNNQLEGTIPRDIANCTKLEWISFSTNRLTGQIPAEIYNMSTLVAIDLAKNYLSGNLPTNMGFTLPNLVMLNLYSNDLRGTIPSSISNSSRLRFVDLSFNQFFGLIPNSLGNLRILEVLALEHNDLTSESSDTGISFITALTNCRYLEILRLGHNPLNGVLPVSVGNLSAFLQMFDAPNCELRGSIPSQIGNLSNLLSMSLSANELTGVIPLTLANMQSLQALNLSGNKLDGTISNTLCQLQQIYRLELDHNRIAGTIPECLSAVTTLRYLLISSNRLTSTIPTSLWNLKDLLWLNLSSNSLSGSLPPEIGNLKSALSIDLSMNQFTNNIPAGIGGLQNLLYLNLGTNRLEGSVPESVGSMLSLTFLDLSHNNLSGYIPKSLEALPYLKYLNVSYNHLQGEIPSNGSFQNFTDESFLFNEALCGAPRFHVPPCHNTPRVNSMTKKLLRIGLIVAGVAALVMVIVLTFAYVRYRWRRTVPTDTELTTLGALERFSYYELLRATDSYNESNLLGTGSFGSVYKGVLEDGKVLAIKVFNLQQEGAFRSFDTECEVLRNLRHRNLTKVLSSCSNDDFKALVLDYMANGSLERWLYSDDGCLDTMQRLEIMIDVACALEYLHHGHITPVAHCDLKPTNILLDQDMVAHVCDFGIAKLFDVETKTYTVTLPTLGYIAPEYGLEGLVSTRCDIYSFGIVLMETFTRKNPNDEMFSGEFSLRRWVEDSLATSAVQVIDASLLRQEDRHSAEKLQCVTFIMELALKCSSESPSERVNMKDVVAVLKKIKLHFIATSVAT